MPYCPLRVGRGAAAAVRRPAVFGGSGVRRLDRRGRGCVLQGGRSVGEC